MMLPGITFWSTQFVGSAVLVCGNGLADLRISLYPIVFQVSHHGYEQYLQRVLLRYE